MLTTQTSELSFAELKLNDNILKSIENLGFKSPTPIQQKAIPILIQGTKDFIGLAQTGTGKTAAFGLPLIQLIPSNQSYPVALVLCPTRELCLQIQNDLTKFSEEISKFRVQSIYGGTSISQQIFALKKGCEIVVATPGRLIDLIDRKAIDLKKIEYVVLDEADEMLNMGFEEDIDFILKNTPERNSMWLFSATMPTGIRKVIKKYMSEPVEVTIGKVNTSTTTIDHQYFIASSSYRYETLKRIIDYNPGIYGIIFARTKVETQEISEKLNREGYNIDAIHGDLSQSQRDRVMDSFRHKKISLLVATDVAARGIDVKDISHVINYELPDELEIYTHRSGRTGRAGKTGICYSIVHSKELFKIKQIGKMNSINFHQADIPSGHEVCRKQFFYFIDNFLATKNTTQDYDAYIPILETKFADLTKEDIIKKLLTTEFDRFIKYYENALDLNLKESKSASKSSHLKHKNEHSDFEGGSGRNFSRNESFDNSNFTTLFINLGMKDGLQKGSILQYICQWGGVQSSSIGKININSLHTLVDVDRNLKSDIINAIDGMDFKGRKIRVNENFEKRSDDNEGSAYKGRRRESFEGAPYSEPKRERSVEGGYFDRKAQDNKGTGYKSKSQGYSGRNTNRDSDYKPKENSYSGFRGNAESRFGGTGFKGKRTNSSEGGSFKSGKFGNSNFSKSNNKKSYDN
ncbi:MAG: DEAD/DEAH box helicase [Alphaproteobacteria bacterium]|nr:DEAD/DEAH box helicase [Alphaproteobacteria bacterium]